MGYNYTRTVKHMTLQYGCEHRGEVYTLPKDLELSYLLDFYGSLLSSTQRDAMEYYYNDDLSLAEISELMNISRQGVRCALKRAENLLLDYEKQLGLRGRFEYTRRELDVIRRAAGDIKATEDIETAKVYADVIIAAADKAQI